MSEKPISGSEGGDTDSLLREAEHWAQGAESALVRSLVSRLAASLRSTREENEKLTREVMARIENGIELHEKWNAEITDHRLTRRVLAVADGNLKEVSERLTQMEPALVEAGFRLEAAERGLEAAATRIAQLQESESLALRSLREKIEALPRCNPTEHGGIRGSEHGHYLSRASVLSGKPET